MKLFELVLSNEDLQGVNCISVVEEAAMEAKFIALSAEKKFEFKEVDKKKLILMGVIMKPNKEILRFDQETNEHCKVFFSEQTIRRVSELYFKKGNQREFNLEHNSSEKLKGYLTESWIVEDTKKDKSAIYNLGADVGDWVGTLKFDSEEEYNKALQSGTGFSIEGLFEEKITLKKEDMDFKQLKDELVGELKQMFAKQVKLGQLKSDDGSMTFEFEGDAPTVGMAITIVTPDGNVPLPIGEYVMENGATVKVTEVGVIGEVVEKTEEVVQEDMQQPTVNDVADLKNAISSMLIKFSEDMEVRFSSIETKLNAQVQENEELKVELSKTPAVERTITAPFEKQSKVELSAMTKAQRLQYTINQTKK
jgi:hypothetical protein